MVWQLQSKFFSKPTAPSTVIFASSAKPWGQKQTLLTQEPVYYEYLNTFKYSNISQPIVRFQATNIIGHIFFFLLCKHSNIFKYLNISRQIYSIVRIIFRFCGHKYIWIFIGKKNNTFVTHCQELIRRLLNRRRELTCSLKQKHLNRFMQLLKKMGYSEKLRAEILRSWIARYNKYGL